MEQGNKYILGNREHGRGNEQSVMFSEEQGYLYPTLSWDEFIAADGVDGVVMPISITLVIFIIMYFTHIH